MAVEVFVIPGFGVAGASGIVLMIVGLILSMVGNIGLDFEPVDGTALFTSAATVLSSILVSIIAVLALGIKLLQAGALSKLVLKAEQSKENGFVSNANLTANWVGKQGIAATDLRPSGKIKIDGVLMDALTEEGYISSGITVKVTGVSNAQLTVITV